VGACLPLLLAASPVPAPDAPKAEQVEKVPPEQALAILGRDVETPDGKSIGRLIDVLVDAAGQPQAAVIDFGGFMGVGARKIAVHWSVLHFMPGDPKRPITLTLTVDQIKAAPEYKDTSKAAPVVVPATAQPATTGGNTAPAKAEPAAGTATKPVQE
jgi:hypothetical protein